MLIKGINTASIKNGNQLVLITFKVTDQNDTQHFLHMQIPTLIDLIIMLRHRMTHVLECLKQQGEEYKAKLTTSFELLEKNLPQFNEQEVMEPNPNHVVMSIAPKFSEDRCSVICIMHDEQVITLDITDIQIEFILMAIQQAAQNSGDNETGQMVTSLLDILLLYGVDLTNLENLSYREVQHEPWKQALFSNHIALLYCFNTESGAQISAGAVIKTNALPQSEELEKIARRIVRIIPGLKEMQEKYTINQIFSRKLPSQPGQLLTIDECLRPLHAFCLEQQASL